MAKTTTDGHIGRSPIIHRSAQFLLVHRGKGTASYGIALGFISVGTRRRQKVGIQPPGGGNPSPACSRGCQFEEHVGCDSFVPFGRKKNVLGVKLVSEGL